MPIALNDVNALCSATQLGKVLGLSTRQVHHLDREGIFRHEGNRASVKRFGLAASVQAYLKFKHDAARHSSNGSTAYEAARARKMAAAALIEELKARQLNGELLDRKRVTLAMTNVISIAKNHLLSVPGRAMHELTMRTAPEANAIVDRHVRAALHELATFDVRKLDHMGRVAVSKKNGAHANSDDDRGESRPSSV